jgi:predicted nucleic acid-binding protein
LITWPVGSVVKVMPPIPKCNTVEAWGKTVSRGAALAIGAMEAFGAATAQTHCLTLVTRNVSDFPLLKAMLNPWTDAGTEG